MQEKRKDIGGLWLNESNGRRYLTGSINGVKVVVFQNSYKTAGDNTPDYRVYPHQPHSPHAPQAQQSAKRSVDLDSDIPF